MRVPGLSLSTMDTMIANATQSEGKYRLFNVRPLSDENEPRDFVLHYREQLVDAATKHGLTDPNKIVLAAIPQYRTARDHVDIHTLIQEASNTDATQTRGGNPSTHIQFVDTYTSAVRSRETRVKEVPNVFVGD
ncbi:hypothetical protein DL93DRAFT_2223423 [Clavulina sp. PMI_390]|nr:hypothetical protein DL93DRAFT_2223423 [Clavulina sp. PMI_390]